ncbi:MAG: hypothetical protein JJU23_00930 [Cyclobacteriaceae bacterium]|nr:hypothetical protein [Cyclobacteriaceae bacterium]
MTKLSMSHAFFLKIILKKVDVFMKNAEVFLISNLIVMATFNVIYPKSGLNYHHSIG